MAKEKMGKIKINHSRVNLLTSHRKCCTVAYTSLQNNYHFVKVDYKDFIIVKVILFSVHGGSVSELHLCYKRTEVGVKQIILICF